MSLALCVANDYEDMSRQAARAVWVFIGRHPSAVIALPTGQTPRLMYRFLVDEIRTSRPALDGVRFANLDEYLGLGPDDPCSFAFMLRQAFLDRLPLPPADVRLLDGTARDPEAECAAHEDWIRQNGGLGLAVLGIGLNGHIAFNEPGTSLDRRTHVAQLTEQTHTRAQNDCPDSQIPAQGITMGIGTILDADEILLLASGAQKAHVLQEALLGRAAVELPASALQSHEHVTVIADKEALADIPSGSIGAGTSNSGESS